jgi:hypothetical protein
MSRRKGLFRRNAATFVTGVCWPSEPGCRRRFRHRPTAATMTRHPVFADDAGGGDVVTMTRLSCATGVAKYGAGVAACGR